MDQDTVINNALRDLKFRNIITENNSDLAQAILEQIFTAGWEQRKKEDDEARQGRNTEIVYYGRNDEELCRYPSITDAGNELEIPRSTIRNTLSGKYKRLRNGHYFRYADNGNGNS